MMHAAVYARKSTEQTGVSDEAKSVTRQVDLARAFATDQGWTVPAEHVYVDDGISGSEATKLVSRARMLAAADAGRFHALVVMNEDRLSRDDEELPGLVYTLRDAGVQVWRYTDRSQVFTRTAFDRGMLAMRSTFAAAEREAAQQRTREALRQRAAHGHVAGGRVLGYLNVRAADGTVTRVVDDGQAAIVRRIFTMAAGGKGLLKIAKTLNAEGVQNPTGQDRRSSTKRSQHWAGSGIRELLHRELYRGRVIYGRTTWTRRRGRKRKVATPPSEWITLEQPELRIISDALWHAAHERMTRSHRVYLRRDTTQSGGLESRYLLSGFLRCGVCGGNLIINRATSKRGRPVLRYICATHKSRPGTCVNRHGVPVDALTDAVIAQLRGVFSTDLAIRNALSAQVIRRRAAPAERTAERGRVLGQVAKVETELRRLTEAIASGGAPETLVAAIREREAERDGLKARVAELDVLLKAPVAEPDLNLDALLAKVLRAIDRLGDTMKRDVPAARRALARVLPRPIKVTARLEGRTLVVTFEGLARYEDLVPEDGPGDSVVLRRAWLTQNLAGSVNHARQPAVSGVWCPRGDSNTRHAV